MLDPKSFAEMIKNRKMVVWNEALMMYWQNLEVVDRTHPDLVRTLDIPFDRKLWSLTAILDRFLQQSDMEVEDSLDADVRCQVDFTELLLRIRDGADPGTDRDDMRNMIQRPPQIVLFTSTTINALSDFVYPDIRSSFGSGLYFTNHAFLYLKNNDVDDIGTKAIMMIFFFLN
ncbi:hypothetical protein BGZ99_000881 [Dissophora globulifera]|uniref:Uncharacterized protein n=1 Tax=Dissophora globulifera TaxID=979702 RepID=A0A9P6RUS2_9FUNG|nr:hypothetical protein BGZ99_000881 [Dissophora globulifera]